VGKTIFGCGQSRDGRPVCRRSYDARAHVPILSKDITGAGGLSREPMCAASRELRRVRVVESRRMKQPKNIVPIGLAAVLALVLSIATIWIVSFQSRTREPVKLAADVARASAAVRHLIGEPMKVGRWTKGNLVADNGDGNADLTIPVYGPLGRGILLEWAQEDTGKWHLCSLLLRSNDVSTSITLVSDASTHCDRE
jgi:hypothetical protein